MEKSHKSHQLIRHSADLGASESEEDTDDESGDPKKSSSNSSKSRRRRVSRKFSFALNSMKLI